MQVAIEFSNDFVAFQTQQQARQDIHLPQTLQLFQNKRATIIKTALSDMAIYAFIAAYNENQKPVINTSREELSTPITQLIHLQINARNNVEFDRRGLLNVHI